MRNPSTIYRSYRAGRPTEYTENAEKKFLLSEEPTGKIYKGSSMREYDKWSSREEGPKGQGGPL